ncbi:MAG TPA: GHKL domain-containing protein [Candidatus Protoclostridium stercorigallinarum]|uniref:GHKL domain-containing protein n=1 Tax=Candidatus Protoclostridium stercorigallinarum TaxID=2838741 RepID=A0A9D1Q1F1_9FIRM|nr:GHKL domain-containing protein [Candidatus Protoclostridium stercorigallinarum]
MTDSLFWYKLVFMGELLVAEGLFTWKLRRRRFFVLRLAAALAVCALAAFFFPVAAYNAAYASLMFSSLFAVSLLGIKFCFREPWKNVLFCAFLSYTVQHLAFVCYNLIVVAMNLVEAGAIGTYLEEAESNYNVFTALAYVFCYYIIYWLSYLFCGTRIERHKDLSVGSSGLLLLSAAILLVVVLFNAVVVYYSAAHYDRVHLIVSFLSGAVSCVLVLVIQFGLVDNNMLRREMDTVQLLRHQEQEQYALAKENIDIINVKCHDLKHKFAAFRGRLEESEINEMENAVMIYDSIVKTGNEVLDVVLTEKSLTAGKNGIRLTVTADDSDLSFMSRSDQYSLFGNIVDNAFEAVMKLHDEEMRVISLDVHTTGKLLSVHLENYFSGAIRFAGGLPETTKSDKRFHGFGMKSVRMIAEKYGGNVTVRTDGGLFLLDILVPVPARDKD